MNGKVRLDPSAPRPCLIGQMVTSWDAVGCILPPTQFALFACIFDAVHGFLINVFPTASCPRTLGRYLYLQEFSRNPVKEKSILTKPNPFLPGGDAKLWCFPGEACARSAARGTWGTCLSHWNVTGHEGDRETHECAHTERLKCLLRRSPPPMPLYSFLYRCAARWKIESALAPGSSVMTLGPEGRCLLPSQRLAHARG